VLHCRGTPSSSKKLVIFDSSLYRMMHVCEEKSTKCGNKQTCQKCKNKTRLNLVEEQDCAHMQVFTYMQYTLIGPIIDSEKV